MSGRRACCDARRRQSHSNSLDSHRNLGHPGILRISSRVELECGTTPAGRRRSSSSRREVSDGPLSSQSVYEQTSGVLRHTPATMTQRGLKHQSLLELIASFPPSHPGNRARRQQGPRGPQRSEGRPSLADWLNLRAVSSSEQETARAPTPRTGGHCSEVVCISSGTSVVVRAVTSVHHNSDALLRILYVVMGCSGTSVHSAKVRSRTSRWVVHSPVHQDDNASVLGLRAVWYATLQRPQRSCCGNYVQSKDCATALRTTSTLLAWRAWKAWKSTTSSLRRSLRRPRWPLSLTQEQAVFTIVMNRGCVVQLSLPPAEGAR